MLQLQIYKQTKHTKTNIFIQSIVKYKHTQDCRHIGPCTHTMLIKNIHTHTHAHTRVRAHTHARKHTHMHTRMHARTHTHTHTYTHTYTHTHTHTHTHMHTKLKLESLSSFLKKTKERAFTCVYGMPASHDGTACRRADG